MTQDVHDSKVKEEVGCLGCLVVIFGIVVVVSLWGISSTLSNIDRRLQQVGLPDKDAPAIPVMPRKP